MAQGAEMGQPTNGQENRKITVLPTSNGQRPVKTFKE
jgi:hypothetical protein